MNEAAYTDEARHSDRLGPVLWRILIRGLGALRRPVRSIRRLAYELHAWRHPNEPWMSYGAIKFLDNHLTPDMVGLEWGSGGSTLWFAKRLRRLLSVEDNPAWHERVTQELRQAGMSHAECRLAQADVSYVGAIDDFPSVDLAVVDGSYRLACIQAALPRLRPGGYLVVDNTDWAASGLVKDWGVPPEWPVVHRSRNVNSETTVWTKP